MQFLVTETFNKKISYRNRRHLPRRQVLAEIRYRSRRSHRKAHRRTKTFCDGTLLSSRQRRSVTQNA